MVINHLRVLGWSSSITPRFCWPHVAQWGGMAVVFVQCQSGSKGVVFGVVSWFRKSSKKPFDLRRISHFRSRFSRHQPVLIVKASKKIIQISKLEEIWKGPQKKYQPQDRSLGGVTGGENLEKNLTYWEWIIANDLTDLTGIWTDCNEQVHKGNSRRDGLLYVYLFDMWHINVSNVWNWNASLGQETYSLKDT